MNEMRSHDLSLAGAGNRAIGTTGRHSSSVGLVVALGVSVRRRDLELGHVDNSLLSSVAAGTAGLGSLLVGSDVEGDEKEEVRADDSHAGEGGELLAGALAHVGNPGEVSRGEVGVGSEVDEACSLVS